MSRVDRYVDDDPGYLDWVARHPDGFVLNTGRTPAPSYLMLHRARCGTITGRPARGTTFTGDYTKVCGSRDELETFAQQQGGLPQPCGTCLGQHARPPGRTPASGKYGPLADYLAGSAGTRVRMTVRRPAASRSALTGTAAIGPGRAWRRCRGRSGNR